MQSSQKPAILGAISMSTPSLNPEPIDPPAADGPAPDSFLEGFPALAAHVTGCPVALLGFALEDRESIAARYRWNVAHLPREIAPGWKVMESGSSVVVPDCHAEATMASNPLVTGEPRIRFYAGVPVRSVDGTVSGVLEVFDRVPRTLSDRQIASLQLLGDQVSTHLALTSRLNELEKKSSALSEVEQELRARDDRFREIFDSVDDLVMTIRPDGRLMHFNAAGPAALGHDAAALTRMSILDLVHHSARKDFSAEFGEVCGSGRPGRIETSFVDAFGRKIVVEGTLSPRMIDGECVLIRVIFRDVTERKRIETELGRARDEALESARLKSQFLNNVSHEIRTPVHGIVGMLGLLADSNPTAEQSEFVNSARIAADSLLQTINNILYASRLEAGKLSAAVADFDLVGSVERVVDVMRVAAQEKGIALDVHLGEGVPMIVRGDPGRYRQVLNNLIGNAIKFTDNGRVDVHLRVEGETDTHTLCRVEVVDTGAGIAEDARPHIFSTFFQADASSSRRHEGVGLGLAISRQLVDLMGGAIGFESAEGSGSTFWFTIPFERRDGERLAVTGSRMAFPGSRVLILDSSDTNRKLIEHHVGSWGMRHRSVRDPQELVERLRSEAAMGDPYHIVIAEYRYPSTDVLSLVQTITGDEQLADTAVVLTTSLGEAVDDGAFRRAKVGAYLPRPVDKSELFDCLTSALAKSPGARKDLRRAPVANAVSAATPEVSVETRALARILLAEDKPLNQKLTLAQLQALGYTAEVASNGVEVVNAMRSGKYNVILMDCQMPVMDGYEATKEVRRLEIGRAERVRIIAMTANALEGDREKCLAAGMDDYLSKPTRREDLEAALARALQ